MDLFEKVSEDIKTAMKAKDKVALDTLRNIKKVFLEAKTAPGANDILTDDAALKIIQKLVNRVRMPLKSMYNKDVRIWLTVNWHR